MAVCRQDIENALVITIDDEAMGDENITKKEIDDIIKRFTQVANKLREDAGDDRDEDRD